MKPFALTASPLQGVMLAAGLLFCPQAVSAQVPDTLPVVTDTVAQPVVIRIQEDSTALSKIPERITPRGAFIRSAIIPGWGHAEVGAHGRGAFYFMVEAISGFMFLKTQTRLDLARDRRALRESVLTEKLTESGVEDPVELEELLSEDMILEDLRGLEETRSAQREDWMALGIFFLFLGGADAYVSAHLADFPGAVEINATPSGGMELGISLPVNF